MEGLTTIELVETYFWASEAIDTQFQYWITVTFAVVVAAFAAGERLTRAMRWVVAGLYLSTAFLLSARIGVFSTTLATVVGHAQDSGLGDLIPIGGFFLQYGRPFILLAGTIAALWFLLKRVPAKAYRE